MNTAHRHLPLTDITPGMVLSDDLLDRQGNILLPKGAVLTDQIIALLPGHGIGMLPIVCEQAAPAKDSAGIERRLASLFRKNDPDDNDDWATCILRRYISDYRLDREIAP
jgi:hypothetical protein